MQGTVLYGKHLKVATVTKQRVSQINGALSPYSVQASEPDPGFMGGQVNGNANDE